MSHFHPGLISAYNSLTDKHLAGYFSNTRIRRHLQRAGLITRSGRIVPDKEYRHKLIQRAHQKHVRECLAQAIFHKVLEMERFHQIEIKRKLEEYATRERVHKIKVDRSKRYEEDVIRILSPRPPTGARGIRKQHSGPEGEHSESSESPGSSRPNTAPGKMQRPVRLKPIHSNSTTASLRRSSPYRLLESSNENHQPFNCTKDKESRRRQTTTEASGGISPYCLPVINNFVTPVPPATKRKDRGVKVNYSGTHRGRRLRPTTASSGADINEDPPILRSSVQQSRVCVNMVYFGKAVHLSHSHDLSDLRDEVKVFQQHCGGENLCVYKGNLIEGETFQFISRRHRGFPFSLTFFLNGLQVERLSSCCEFKHRKGPRLGGRHGHFGFFSVEGASPCYKCIIAMGLDKKPTPPPKRVKEDGGREKSAISPKDAAQMETERTGEDAAFHSERETSRPQEVEAQIKEETATEEDKVRDDYEEDFEADDEGPTEDVEAKAKKSPSPSSEAERQVKERDASETEDDQKDEDIKSQSGSSSSGSDREESDAEEATRDCKEDETAEQPKEVDQEETAVPPEEREEPHPEEAATTTEAESAVPQDSDTQNSTEVDIYEASVPSGNENKWSEETLGDKEAEKRVDESRQEEEPERAKSVQEKLADAILKESQRSSEPELSDTSTEEEEFTDKSPKQDNNDAVSEKSLTFTERQQSIVGETQCHENVVGEAEVVAQDQEDTSQTKTQEDETEQEPQEKSESTKDEEKIEEDRNEKAISGEDNHTTENDKSEGTEDTAAALQPVYEEETAEEAKTPEKDEENKSKTGVEADETGQGPKSSEQDESTVSEAHKKTEDDTAALDNAAEAGAMTTCKTMEMKAEPSEEPEALNCEEAPVAEMEVTAETSSISLEGSRHATAEIIADASEGNEDDTKEEEAEKVSAVEASKNDNQLEVGDLGEEQTETSVEGDDKVEEKSEKEEDQTNPDELTEGDKSVESQADNKDKKEEEEENNESKTEATIENENILEANEEHAGKTCSDEKKVADEEKVDESEKGEDGDLVENENSEDKLDGNGVTPEKVCVAENISETNTAAEKGKDNDAEKEEEDQKENIDEQSAINKETEESEEMKVGTEKIGEGEEKPEIAEEPLKTATADLDEENAKIPNEIIVEPEDVRNNEVANVANGTETTEETQNSKTEDEDVKKDIETVSGENEKGEIDAENGEISTGAENKSNEDEGNAQIEGENDLKITEVYKKTEDHMRDESPEVNVPGESGDGAEHHVDHKVDRPLDTDVVESGAKGGDESVEKQDESTRNESTEPEVSGIEAKEESEESEELKQDEDLADPHNENRDSDVPIRNDNVQSDISELVVLASSLDQAQPSTPMAVDSDDTAHKLNKSTVTSDSQTDKHPPTDQNANDADLSAADGENGDTEEASKASEEGASVLLKPQANSPPLTQHDKAENTAESIVAGKESPEVLVREDNTDLVTNWLSMHQSHFLETFVEPLEDLKELPSDVQVSCSNKEATQSTEPPRSASPIKTAKMSEENTLKDASESGDITKEETVESDFESNQPEEKKPEDTSQVQEETEVKDLIPKTESEQNDRKSVNKQDMRSEEHKGSVGSLEEDKVPDDLVQDDSEKTDISKTEVESIASIRHSVTVGGSESISENQTEETTTDDGPKMNATQTAIVKVNDPLPNTETEVHGENLSSPKGLPGLRTNTLKDTSETWEQSREDTEITDFRASWSDNGSREGSHYKDVLPIPSDTSTSGDRRHVIQDITDSLSKDQLSTFSVDETLFGRGSHPLLTAVRTESGH